MAADDFTLVPAWVIPIEPKYNNEVTPSESMKKERMNISATPVKYFRLKFEGMSDADWGTFLAHFNGRYGDYDQFSWQSVPSYIESGANMDGHWVKGSLQPTPRARSWDWEVVFEKAN